MTGIPVERVEALVKLLFPEEMTPRARSMFQQVCDEHSRSWSAVAGEVMAPFYEADTIKPANTFTPHDGRATSDD